MAGEIRGFVRVVVAVCAAVVLAGCSTNPATGKRILALMDRDQEIALGAQAAPQFTEEFGGAVAEASLQQYVNGIGRNLARFTEADYPTMPWEFTLLDSGVINAFALPGGKVFFTRGLASKLTSEAEMAGVLGHEVGHVTAQHGNQRISQSQLLAGGLAVSAVLVGVSGDRDVQRAGAVAIPALAVGGQVVLLKYGRDQELEADKLGVRYMVKNGYDPRGQLMVMQVLKREAAGGGQPDILSTHPNPDDRIAQIQGMLQGEYAHTQGNSQFQLYQDRYRAEFLNKLAKLPPPKHGVQKASADGLLAQPWLWCAHCRDELAGTAGDVVEEDGGSASARGAQTGEDLGPVPPREGIYAFFGPPAGR